MKRQFNKFINNFRKSRKAIAPAIAVALLLAVTIALVAAVGYTTTMVTPTIEESPQAVFDVSILKTGGSMGTGTIKIKQLSGMAVETQNLKLKFIADGVATEVFPNQNNTFYMNWALYNPPGHNNDTWSGYKANPEGIEELVNEAGEPLNVTAIGVHIQNSATEDDDVKYWYSPVSVKLQRNDTKAWVDLGSLSGYSSPAMYVDPWSAVECGYQMYYIANTNNEMNFTAIQVTNAFGVTVVIDLTDEDFSKVGVVDSGDALYLRMSEWNSPFLYSIDETPNNSGDVHFGNFAIGPGATMKTYAAGYPFGVGGNQACISNWDAIDEGDVVEVYIIYTPSNQVIWQGDVVVE